VAGVSVTGPTRLHVLQASSNTVRFSESFVDKYNHWCLQEWTGRVKLPVFTAMLYLKETLDLSPVPPNLPSWQLQVATHYWLP
jgi:hypothetical protein